MTNNEYTKICSQIIASTMQYIDTTNIKSFKVDKTTIPNNIDMIYKSAITSSAPISLIYTPAGTGKSQLIIDRVHALQSAGIPSDRIMVLNMNIAKTKQTANQLPGVNVMTFSEFTHNIFAANTPDCIVSDLSSIKNTLLLGTKDALTIDFINKLSIEHPQDKNILLTLFVNQHLDFTYNLLRRIHKSEYSLESMICQNMIYRYAVNPYNVDSIIINGVHNMPIPILCSILAYANRYKCNLYMTGSPEETIYEFNMAFGNAMNILSSYANKNIDVIRLKSSSTMQPNIYNVLNMVPNGDKSDIYAELYTVTDTTPTMDILDKTFGAHTDYLVDKINKKQQTLIMARSKDDIAKLALIINTTYKTLCPNLKLLDLTQYQIPAYYYATVATNNVNEFIKRYPTTITVGQFFAVLYDVFANECNIMAKSYLMVPYRTNLVNMQSFVAKHITEFGSMNTVYKSVNDIIQKLINVESNDIQNHITAAQNSAEIDVSKYDIILSTIHSAIDIRCDNAILFLRNNNANIDNALYRVALSRANKTEYLIFANKGKLHIPYIDYLKP